MAYCVSDGSDTVGVRPSPGAATSGRVGQQELSNHHPAADVAVPETGTLRSAGLQPALDMRSSSMVRNGQDHRTG